jgi:phospholipid N-methyltransferase
MNIFLKQAFLNFKQTGALFKSSIFLSKKIASLIPNPDLDKLIVEFGPGNGGITKEILNSMSKNSKLVVFELNPVFCNELGQIKDKRLTVINESAIAIKDFEFYGKVDCIISSLPLASINKQIKTAIFKEVKNTLTKEGLIIQYQYSLLDYSFLRKRFKNIKLRFTLLNVPPSFIYICKN